MINLDLLKQKKEEIYLQLNKAMKEGNEGEYKQALESLLENVQQQVMEEAKSLVQANDASILTGRGVRQLTSEEKGYFQKVIDAMKTSNPKQSLTDLDVVLPKTVIDAVFDDLQKNHPLISKINFVNTSGMIEYLVNTNEAESAAWGTLTAEIVKELTSGYKKISMLLRKLSAFLPVAKSMLDLGPAWMDRYVRIILGEALLNGLESGMISGDGKESPRGMNRKTTGAVDGVYPVKDLVPLTSFDPISYGAILALLAEDANGNTRTFNEVILIVNQVDYLTKVMPATTIRAADGTFVNNVFPFPTMVIPSTQIGVGKALVGLPEKYFMGIGTAQNGKIEYDDSYKFLEDERVYLIKLYGYGEALDENAFVYCDISDLQPAYQKYS